MIYNQNKTWLYATIEDIFTNSKDNRKIVNFDIIN